VRSVTDLRGVAVKAVRLNDRLVETDAPVAAVYLVICSVASRFVPPCRKPTVRLA
jgi:hypothetical protein